MCAALCVAEGGGAECRTVGLGDDALVRGGAMVRGATVDGAMRGITVDGVTRGVSKRGDSIRRGASYLGVVTVFGVVMTFGMSDVTTRGLDLAPPPTPDGGVRGR
ncbi:MAG: hypothetical protein U0793_12605 [Gemmataceae bacterium]